MELAVPITPDHPLAVFTLCPSCGSRDIAGHDNKAIICRDCGFVYFGNPAAAVAALIRDETGRLLFTVRAHDPGKGMLDLPGGFVDPGETAEQALRREIREELGITLSSVEYLTSFPNKYNFKNVTYNTLDMAFMCNSTDLERACAMDDIDDIVFIDAGRVDYDKIAFGSVRRIVQYYIGTRAKE